MEIYNDICLVFPVSFMLKLCCRIDCEHIHLTLCAGVIVSVVFGCLNHYYR